MESTYSQQREAIEHTLHQISNGILQLKQWTDGVSIKFLPATPQGAQDLAGDVMLLQAICEGVKQIQKRTSKLLPLRPEIPWRHIMSMRDRIAHGYFEIDIDYVEDIISNDLDPLLDAINTLCQLLPTLSDDELF